MSGYWNAHSDLDWYAECGMYDEPEPEPEDIMTYDPASYELACYFLADEHRATDADRDALAQHIQRAVEDWLNDELPRRMARQGITR